MAKKVDKKAIPHRLTTNSDSVKKPFIRYM